MIENFHSLLTSIEELYETEKFNGPEERFFNIVEKVSSNRPVSKTALVVVISTNFLLRERRSKDYHDWLVRMRGRPSLREVFSGKFCVQFSGVSTSLLSLQSSVLVERGRSASGLSV